MYEEDRPFQSLILDLDETLICTFPSEKTIPEKYKNMKEKDIGKRLYSFDIGDSHYCGIKRPYLDEFLTYCFDRFGAVGVWSAGTKEYVDEIVKVLKHNKKLVCVMSRDDCDVSHEESKNKRGYIVHDKADYCKPLHLLFRNKSEFFNRRCTFVLDDRRDYAHHNLLNWLQIPPYEPDINNLENDDDDYLLKLKDWLDRDDVQFSENVMTLPKEWYQFNEKKK